MHHSGGISVGHSRTCGCETEDLKLGVPLKNLHLESLLDIARNKKGFGAAQGHGMSKIGRRNVAPDATSAIWVP